MSILERGKFRLRDWHIVLAIILFVVGAICVVRGLIMFIV